MDNLQAGIKSYMDFCEKQKRLDSKTLKAYRIDLKQFQTDIPTDEISEITPLLMEQYIAQLHQSYTPKTVKRKIASVKALFHYFEFRDLIALNPFNKIQIKFREPVILPKTIPLYIVELFLKSIYNDYNSAPTPYSKKTALKNIAISELLFATGIRISELCSLKSNDVNLQEQTILINGKGSKERRIQIGSDDVIQILKEYQQTYHAHIEKCGYFFVSRTGQAISDQSIRRMINKYTTIAAIDMHITPHMFRHTFATSLLDADVDIRYIQEMLGHSSINITEIYTHVSMSKQRDILTTKHPRKDFCL